MEEGQPDGEQIGFYGSDVLPVHVYMRAVNRLLSFSLDYLSADNQHLSFTPDKAPDATSSTRSPTGRKISSPDARWRREEEAVTTSRNHLYVNLPPRSNSHDGRMTATGQEALGTTVASGLESLCSLR
jgi:hypothetical protein